MQHGILTDNDVSRLSKSSLYRVRRTFIAYCQRRCTLQKRVYWHHLHWDMLVSIISTIIILLTLREMQIARDTAYKPCIQIDGATVAFAWNAEHKKIDDIDRTFFRSVIGDTDPLNEVPILVIRNLGSGIARNIRFNWQYIDNLRALYSYFLCLDSTPDYVYQIMANGVYVDSEWSGTVFQEGYGVFQVPYLSNDRGLGKTKYSVELPSMYYSLIASMISNCHWVGVFNADPSDLYKLNKIPDIVIALEYSDMQGKTYKENISLRIKIDGLTFDPNSITVGTISIQQT
jgi:hypothetical protein